MQSLEDEAKAKEGERAFHARLSAAQHQMETDPNPWERRRAADIVNHMTCGRDARAHWLPDDRLWFGSQWLYRYQRYDHQHDPALDKYFNRCRRLWREQVSLSSSSDLIGGSTGGSSRRAGSKPVRKRR